MVTHVFTGVPARPPEPVGAPFAPRADLPPEPAVTFLTRLSGEVARHPTRLVAACLATVLGPGVVAYAGTADLHPPTPAVSGEQIATEAPSSVPQPGDPVTWQAAARAAAATCPGLPADVLVAIGRVESNLCLQAVPSQAGAEGPMQFLPSTWAAYGMDGDGDGRADVNDPVDALHGAARLLCANGGADAQRLQSALWNYNHSDDYVRQILSVAGVTGSGTGPGTLPAS